ncbi:MAG TPA: hypothetical protein VMJ32_07350 [Pirellulales bacterium]|nr:hypothetical protein [Pirellulales bacterium]
MSLLNWIETQSAARQIAAWGAEVAQQCQAEVALRLGQNVHRLSLPAARGYIRARSASVLDQEMLVLVESTHCSGAVAAAVRQTAMDEIIRMAMGDLLKVSRPHGQRKAA